MSTSALLTTLVIEESGAVFEFAAAWRFPLNCLICFKSCKNDGNGSLYFSLVDNDTKIINHHFRNFSWKVVVVVC